MKDGKIRCIRLPIIAIDLSTIVKVKGSGFITSMIKKPTVELNESGMLTLYQISQYCNVWLLNDDHLGKRALRLVYEAMRPYGYYTVITMGLPELEMRITRGLIEVAITNMFGPGRRGINLFPYDSATDAISNLFLYGKRL